MRADQIGGLAAALLGLAAILEAARLYPMRLSPFVGDHMMPAVVGVLLVLLGSWQALRGTDSAFAVAYPRGREARSLLGTVACLGIYWFAMPRLGYLLDTWIVASVLFNLIGGMRWFRAWLCGTVLTAAVYAVFLVGLSMSLPGGWLEGLLNL
jgi:putative tricarboxylic transport membrane protein